MINEYLRLAIFLSLIVLLYGLEMRFLINKFRKHKEAFPYTTHLGVFIHLLAIIGVLCFAYAYFIEPYWIELKTVEIATSKLKKTELMIVQISDLHCDEKVRNEHRLVEMINRLQPDIIVFTGDALNTRKALPTFKELMTKLTAKIAKFAVYGNFDYWYWRNLDLFSGTGFELLDQQARRLTINGEVFYISGLSYGFSAKYRELLENIPADNFSIFLYHYPGLIEKIKGLNVDLYLSGHTHGGQVALPFYGAIVTLSDTGKKY